MRCDSLLCCAHFILIGTKTDNFYILDNEQYVFYNFLYVIISKHITLQYFLFENISKYFGKTFVIFAIYDNILLEVKILRSGDNYEINQATHPRH